MIYKFQNSGVTPQIDATRVIIPPGEYKRTTIQQDHDALVKWNLEHPNDKVYRIEDLIQKEKEANPSWIKRAANLAVNPIPTSNFGMIAVPNPDNPVRSTVKDELGVAMAAASVPMLGSEIGIYGGLGAGLRFGAGSAAATGASYAGGKAGDWLDDKLGANWIGDTNRLVLPFITFPIGMKGANSILRSAAGHGITMGMPQETFANLRSQYFTNAGNKALVNLNSKSNPTLTSTINHLYKEYPELSSIGPKEAYRQYYETIFPASKVQTPYAHGTKSDLSGGLETSVKIPNAAAPETIGRNDFYLNLQPETSLQYADGIGVPEGFTWNKHRFWPLKEILGKPYKSDAWMSKPIKLREQVPNRAGQFSRVKNADGTYSGHGKLLEEYKAELGMQGLSNEEFLQRLGVQNKESFNQWVAKNRQMFSDIYDSGDYHGLYHVKIDANKPLTINGGDTYYSERGIWDRMNKGGNDVLLHNNAANEFGSDVAVVRDVTPQRVRILGSKPDQQGFADFMGGKQQFFTEIPTSPQEAATTYHWDPRVKVLSRPISNAEKKGIVKHERPMHDPEVLEKAKLFAEEYGYPEPKTPEEIKNMYRRHNTFFRTVVDLDRTYFPEPYEAMPDWFKQLDLPGQRKILASRGYPSSSAFRGYYENTNEPFADGFVFASPSLEQNADYFINGALDNTVKLQRPFSLRDPKTWHKEADWRIYPKNSLKEQFWPKGRIEIGNASPTVEFKVSTKHLIPVDIAKPDDLGTLLPDYLQRRVNEGIRKDWCKRPKWLSGDPYYGNYEIDYFGILPEKFNYKQGGKI